MYWQTSDDDDREEDHMQLMDRPEDWQRHHGSSSTLARQSSTDGGKVRREPGTAIPFSLKLRASPIRVSSRSGVAT